MAKGCECGVVKDWDKASDYQLEYHECQKNPVGVVHYVVDSVRFVIYGVPRNEPSYPIFASEPPAFVFSTHFFICYSCGGIVSVVAFIVSVSLSVRFHFDC